MHMLKQLGVRVGNQVAFGGKEATLLPSPLLYPLVSPIEEVLVKELLALALLRWK